MIDVISNLSGVIGNFSSIIMWFTSAILIRKNRKDSHALKSVSLLMQSIAVLNTVAWCINGLSTQNYNLTFGTVVILPTVVFTIVVKIKSNKVKKQPQTQMVDELD